MKCKICGLNVKPKLNYICPHTKTKTWTCPKDGMIKSYYIIDGEVMRKWELE